MRFTLSTTFIALSMHLLSASAVKIMPLGDSITEWSCWRAMLQRDLRAAGHTNIDFVGSLSSTSICTDYAGFDSNHEGHSGYQAVNIANQNQLPPWLSSTRPEIVIMHLGTNDVWNSRSASEIITSFGKLVDQMRASRSNMKILVAKIIPMNPSNCATCGARVVELNNQIATWASSKSTSTSPITVVDQWSGFSTGSDTTDGVHTNSNGDVKMARKWLAPLIAAIGSTSPAPTTTSGTPVPTGGSGTAPAWGQCGGIGWTGPTTCVSGYTCKQSNPYYSQCTP